MNELSHKVNPEVRICLEYKMNDPRARCLLGNAGETLAFCQRLGLPNVGVIPVLVRNDSRIEELLSQRNPAESVRYIYSIL